MLRTQKWAMPVYRGEKLSPAFGLRQRMSQQLQYYYWAGRLAQGNDITIILRLHKDGAEDVAEQYAADSIAQQ
jgi:hypothetical protein